MPQAIEYSLYIRRIKYLCFVCLFFAGCSSKTQSELKMATFDSLYNRPFFLKADYHFDTIESDFNKNNVERSSMIDRYQGVRNIREVGNLNNSDSVEEASSFFLEKRVFKIYIIRYPKDSIGKRSGFGKCLYYFDNDSIIHEEVYKLKIDPFEYKRHFERLAYNFKNE